MSEPPAEDSTSVHSVDSNEVNSVPTLMEKFENLIIQESKHSHNFYDLHTRDNFAKLDVENLNNLCQRYEDQKNAKCVMLENHHHRLLQIQKRNMEYLKDKMTIVVEKLEQVNSSFCEAYEDYNSDVLRNTINFVENEAKKIETELSKNTCDLVNKQAMMNESLKKSKTSFVTGIDTVINLLSDSSMKRPEIELEEITSRLQNDTIPNLKKKLEKYGEIKSRCK
ncbi:uncharacterized protein LOC106636532 [Copidosoma floridanum]|uniref:uncharacterized protein LOC106636532 n=1 Tax=Copidosoma floridanum TaxID=29053 RepID=UPI0006C996AC|nr:uncharacterized protein LOC106636532 [Copidosoma floridanum]